MLKYIILGRTNSGKKSLLKNLIKHGIKVNKSYTTNPYADSEIYDIIPIEKVHEIQNKILIKQFGEFIYFTTEERLEDCQVISLDINGFKELSAISPYNIFRFVYVQADKFARLNAYLSNFEKDKKLEAEEAYKNRCDNENDEFDEFEKQIFVENKLPYNLKNVLHAHVVFNDMTENSDIFKFYKQILDSLGSFERMKEIIVKLLQRGQLEHFLNENKNIFVKYITNDSETNEYKNQMSPLSYFIEYSLITPYPTVPTTILDLWLNPSDESAIYAPLDKNIKI